MIVIGYYIPILNSHFPLLNVAISDDDINMSVFHGILQKKAPKTSKCFPTPNRLRLFSAWCIFYEIKSFVFQTTNWKKETLEDNMFIIIRPHNTGLCFPSLWTFRFHYGIWVLKHLSLLSRAYGLLPSSKWRNHNAQNFSGFFKLTPSVRARNRIQLMIFWCQI